MPTQPASSGSDISGVHYAELRIRRRVDSPIETLVVQRGRYSIDGRPCKPFDFWAEHDNAARVLGLRLRHNALIEKSAGQ